MPDIDEIALDVARRFTQDGDAQGRAQLQVAIIEAIRSAQQPFPLTELEAARDQLHVMSAGAPVNWCDVTARLQGQVQQIIDEHRRAFPEGRS